MTDVLSFVEDGVLDMMLVDAHGAKQFLRLEEPALVNRAFAAELVAAILKLRAKYTLPAVATEVVPVAELPRAKTRRVAKPKHGWGSPYSAYDVLDFIRSRRQGATFKDVAEHFEMSRQTAGNRVRHLANQGHVTYSNLIARAVPEKGEG